MYKSRVVIGCMALVLALALLIPLVGCKSSGTTATPTPTGTTAGATTTATKTPTLTKAPTAASTPTATATPTPAGGGAGGPPLLKLISSCWDPGNSRGFSGEVLGNVTNISGGPQYNVTAVVSCYTADGGFIKSNWGWIDDNPINAGDTASFTVYWDYDSTVDHVSISFAYAEGTAIPSTQEGVTNQCQF